MVTTWRPFFCSSSLQWPLPPVDFKARAQHYNLSIAKKEALTRISKVETWSSSQWIKVVLSWYGHTFYTLLKQILNCPMADSASIWIMILLRKVRTWLNQQYLKWFQTTSVHHQHRHDSTCICFLRSIKLATLVDQIIVSACCCATENVAFYLDQIMCPLVHNLSTYVNQWFQFGQHNDSQTLPLHHGHKNNIYCYPITVALKCYLISSTSIPFSTHLQEHTCTLQSFFECFFFFSWRMQTFHSFQRTCDSTDEGPGPKRLQRNSNHKKALLSIIFCRTFLYLPVRNTVEPVPKEQLDMPGGHSWEATVYT